MWDEHKQARFQVLRQCEVDGALTAAEQAELRQMIQEIESHEAAYLRPATARLRAERERLEAQNRALQAVVQRKEAFAMRLRVVLAELATERQAIDAELARILGESAVTG